MSETTHVRNTNDQTFHGIDIFFIDYLFLFCKKFPKVFKKCLE